MILYILAALPIVLGLLVIAAIIAGSWFHERDMAKLAGQPCPTCGGTLGREAVAVAYERVRKQAEQRMKEAPGIRLRMILLLEIVCPACGGMSTWKEGRPIDVSAIGR